MNNLATHLLNQYYEVYSKLDVVWQSADGRFVKAYILTY